MTATDTKLERLKEEFAKQYPYGELKVQSGRLISLYFPRIVMIRSDYAKLTYVYRNP